MDHKTRRGLWLAMGMGVGLGLIAAGVLIAFQPAQRLTDAAVRDRAKALGMVDPTQMQGAAKPPAETAPAPAAKPAVTFVIAPGMAFSDVASMLKVSGVIADQEAFTARARERDLLEQLKPGVYTVPVGDPVDKLLDKIVGAAS